MARADRAVAPDMVFLPLPMWRRLQSVDKPGCDPYGKIPEFKFSAVRVSKLRFAPRASLRPWGIPRPIIRRHFAGDRAQLGSQIENLCAAIGVIAHGDQTARLLHKGLRDRQPVRCLRPALW